MHVPTEEEREHMRNQFKEILEELRRRMPQNMTGGEEEEEDYEEEPEVEKEESEEIEKEESKEAEKAEL